MTWADFPRYYVIQKLWDRGVRARDWPLSVILDLLKNPESDIFKYQYHLVAYYAYLDRRLYRDAAVHIAAAEQEVNRHNWEEYHHVTAILLERSFILSHLRLNLELSNSLINRVDFPLDDQEPLRFRARAALQVAQGNIPAARNLADEAARRIRELHPEIKPNIQAEFDWLEWIFEIPA